MTGIELLPGLPVAALMFVCPLLAAMIRVYQEQGRGGVSTLLQRAFDFRRITAKVWYLPMLFLMPVVSVAAFVVLRLRGMAVPMPQIAVLPTLLLGGVFFIAGLGEELGWSGYAIDPMQARWGALQASLVLGVIWAGFHYVALAQAHRSLGWVVGWSLGTVASRVIIVWLYNNTGHSVGAAALFHMMINVTWQLFPVHGSYYDPLVSGGLLAVVATIILLVWGPRTLTRSRTARSPSLATRDAST